MLTDYVINEFFVVVILFLRSGNLHRRSKKPEIKSNLRANGMLTTSNNQGGEGRTDLL